ncbi:MAG: ribosomal protein [Alphaproteobacteria bacterium]|jgi:small subunit ribosomal protein S20|nr:ribosomal protein [Alphaproteobacteria bacterium]
MANHSSSKKAIRQIETRTEQNRMRVSRIRTFVKKVESLLAEGNQSEVVVALREAESEIMRGVSKGVIHKNTASRKVSRLSKRVKALGVA